MFAGRNYRKSKSKKRDTNKKRQKHKKQDSSDSSLGDCNLSDVSDYISKKRKKNIHQKKDHIRICAMLLEEFLTTAYKSKIIKFKLDEGPLQLWIYFLTFVESLEMILSQYKETFEVLLNHPKLERRILNIFKNAIRNILHAKIYVHIRRLINEFPGYGVKCIAKIQSNCANISFSGKSRYDRIFQQVTHKGGESAMKYIKIFQTAQDLSI